MALQELGGCSKALCRTKGDEGMCPVFLADHMEFLEEAPVTGSPLEPEFCRMIVAELSLSNFILWQSLHGKLVGLGSFPFGFPFPHNKGSTGFVLNFNLVPARPLCDSGHLVGKVLSCSSPEGSQHPEGEIPAVLPGRGGSEWGQLKTPVKS